MARFSTTLRRTAAIALVVTLSACGGGGVGIDLDESDYEDGVGITAAVLPQIAADGEDPEASAAADYVVDATVEGAPAGQTVELQVRYGRDWETVDSAETDEEGRVMFRVGPALEMRVVSVAGSEDGGDDGEGVGIHLTTTAVPEPTFADEFDTLNPAVWGTRDQGYTGVRLCSRASDDAVEVVDGVMRLSVLNDPDRGACRAKKRFDYRLNGHVGSAYAFTYGVAAARIKFQEGRGQHGAFWLQGFGAVPTGPAAQTGAEIDIIEYFGDGHPEGGLTSFVYWYPNEKGKTAGSWLKDPEQYGDDWSSKFHVFSVEWTPEQYVFRIDGHITDIIRQGVSAQPEFLILSLLSSDYELKNIDEADLPQHMEVDWAKVWPLPPE